MSLQALHRYSRYVTLMKTFLFVGILLILGVSVVGPYILSFQKEQESAEQIPSDNRMIHPHYMATDNKGQPYAVKAELATQTAEDQPTDLKNPEGSLTLSEGQTLNVKAENGVYNAQEKLLKLEGGVILKSTDGYDVKTPQADILLDSKIIEGTAPVKAVGPKGSLEGKDGFKIVHKEEGDVITLKGRSQVIINKVDGA